MKDAILARVSFALICVVLASSVSAAPYRWLMTVQNDSYDDPVPISQYYQSGATSSAEFYDHPNYETGVGYPWGGTSGYQSIKAVPQNVHIDPATGGIDTFQLSVSITNDTYETSETLWSTYGWNDLSQNADDILTQQEIIMRDVKLCLEFADDGVLGNMDPDLGIEPLVYAIGYDDLAWYGYSYDQPPQAVPGSPGGYVVPAYNITTSLAPGATATKVISFGTHLPIMSDDPLYSMLTSGDCTDLFANRTSSLKISNYPDAISGCDTDETSPWNVGANSSNVSVFFNSPESEPCLGVNGVYPDEETPGSQFWWHDVGDMDKEILRFELRPGSGSPVVMTGVTLWCDEYMSSQYVQEARVYADMNNSGFVDEGDILVGSGSFDPATGYASIPITAPQLEVGDIGHAIVAFVVDPEAPSGSEFYCDLVNASTAGCQNILGLPVYSEWRQWAQKMTIPQVKQLVLDENAETQPIVVVEAKATLGSLTDDWSGLTYLEEGNRSCGIRVESNGAPPPPPMVDAAAPSSPIFRAVGYVQSSWTGETYISSEWFEQLGYGDLVTPVAMPNRSVGGGAFGNQVGVMHDVVDAVPGSGLNNVGLLVKTWGIVTYTEPWGKGFWIEDGTGRRSGNTDDYGEYVYGIYVTGEGSWWNDYMPGSGWPFEAPAVGTKVAVTGLSTIIDCYDPNSGMQVPGPCIMLRSADDLQSDATPQ